MMCRLKLEELDNNMTTQNTPEISHGLRELTLEDANGPEVGTLLPQAALETQGDPA